MPWKINVTRLIWYDMNNFEICRGLNGVILQLCTNNVTQMISLLLEWTKELLLVPLSKCKKCENTCKQELGSLPMITFVLTTHLSLSKDYLQ